MSPHSERSASKFQAVGAWKGSASLVEEGELDFIDRDKQRFYFEARRTVGCSLTLNAFHVDASGDIFTWQGSAVVSVESSEAHKIGGKEVTDTWSGKAQFSVHASLSIIASSNTYSLEIGKEGGGASAWLVHTHSWYGKELSDKEPWAGGELPAGYDIPLPSSGLTLTHHREKKSPIDAHTVIIGKIDITWKLTPADDAVDRAIRERLRHQLEKQQQIEAQRIKAKKAAAGAAVAMNDTGAVLAGAAAVLGGVAAGLAVTGVGVPAAAGVAVIAGLASGIAWYTSGRYQELANDPPRDDFQTISVFKPTRFKLHKPADAFEATWQNFVTKNVLLASAMHALIVSLERYDGTAMATEARRRSAQLKQIEAIVQNATACAQQLEAMAAMRSEVNVMWKQHMAVLVAAGRSNERMVLDTWPDQFNHLWRACLPQLRDEYNLSSADIQELDGIVHQRIMEQKSLPTLPRVLFDANWAKTMKNLAAQLRHLSTAYEELRKILS